MQTVAVYTVLAALIVWAWPRGCGYVIPTLAANFVSTALIGQLVQSAPDQDAWMIICDLCVVYGMRFWCIGARSYFVGLISLSVIVLRTVNMGLPVFGAWHFAAAVNIAFAAQLLIAGGIADDVGRWVDRWVFRLWPRGAGLFRYVAGS